MVPKHCSIRNRRLEIRSSDRSMNRDGSPGRPSALNCGCGSSSAFSPVPVQSIRSAHWTSGWFTSMKRPRGVLNSPSGSWAGSWRGLIWSLYYLRITHASREPEIAGFSTDNRKNPARLYQKITLIYQATSFVAPLSTIWERHEGGRTAPRSEEFDHRHGQLDHPCDGQQHPGFAPRDFGIAPGHVGVVVRTLLGHVHPQLVSPARPLHNSTHLMFWEFRIVHGSWIGYVPREPFKKGHGSVSSWSDGSDRHGNRAVQD